jgi:phosphoribosylformimino-5-aminoimidazole carboxamide ribotide isomerase
MILFPAIDLMDGNVVRLQQGDFQTKTVYHNDPVTVAKSYEAAGATWLHIVDLDGAKSGRSQNLRAIEAIRKETTLKIQVGGGMRSETAIQTMLELGVDRVILGTLAVTRPALLKQLVDTYQDRIVVSVDSHNNQVTYSGWQDTSAIPTLGFVKKLEQLGVRTIVYTDIAKDGMMEGPNFDDYAMLARQTKMNVIASGGVSTMDDLKTLAEMDLYGAIIGKALYLRQIDLKEAIRCLPDESSPA